MVTGVFCALRTCPPLGSKRSLRVPPCRLEKVGFTQSHRAAIVTSEEVDKSESGERLVPKFLLCNVEVHGEVLQSVKRFCSGKRQDQWRLLWAATDGQGRGEEQLRGPEETAASTEANRVSGFLSFTG